MRPGRATSLVFGSPMRRSGYAIAMAAGLTVAAAGTFIGSHWWANAADIGMMFTAGGTPQFSHWSPTWMNRLWFGLIIAWCVLSLFLAIRHVANGGGLFGAFAYVGVVPVATLAYHRIVFAFPELFWPVLPESMRTRWELSESLLMEWWIYLGPMVLVLATFAVGRWISRQPDRLRTDVLVVSGLWLGTFFADLARHVVMRGQLFVPQVHYLDREPLLYWTREMIVRDLPYLGYTIWYATVAAVIGWILLNGYRWVGTIRERPVIQKT